MFAAAFDQSVLFSGYQAELLILTYPHSLTQQMAKNLVAGQPENWYLRNITQKSYVQKVEDFFLRSLPLYPSLSSETFVKIRNNGGNTLKICFC